MNSAYTGHQRIMHVEWPIPPMNVNKNSCACVPPMWLNNKRSRPSHSKSSTTMCDQADLRPTTYDLRVTDVITYVQAENSSSTATQTLKCTYPPSWPRQAIQLEVPSSIVKSINWHYQALRAKPPNLVHIAHTTCQEDSCDSWISTSTKPINAECIFIRTDHSSFQSPQKYIHEMQ